MEHWTEYSRFFIALLVILDPFAAIPIFLGITKSSDTKLRNRIADVTALTAFAVLVFSALLGETLLLTMGTSLASFRVGGGIVLLLMALAMLKGHINTFDATPLSEYPQSSEIAIVPLAIPLLAGPGAISTVIIEMHRSDAQYHAILVMLTIFLVSVLLWLVLRMASRLGKSIGPVGINIINRIFGLILAAIAIEIMANGLKQLFPILAGFTTS